MSSRVVSSESDCSQEGGNAAWDKTVMYLYKIPGTMHFETGIFSIKVPGDRFVPVILRIPFYECTVLYIKLNLRTPTLYIH